MGLSSPLASGAWEIEVFTPDQLVHMGVVAAATNNSDYSPHGDVLYCGAAEGDRGRFLWLDECSVTIAGTITVFEELDYTFQMFLYQDGQVVPALTAEDTATIDGPFSKIITVERPGYYSFWVTATKACNFAFANCFIDGNKSVWCHRPLPDFSINGPATQGIRINAVSMMYTNEAPIMEKQGKIVAYQVPEGKSWTGFINNFDNASRANGSSLMVAASGAYAWLKPTKPEDFNFMNEVEYAQSNLINSAFPLKPQSAFLMLYTQINEADGQSGYYTFGYGIEYQTTDVWRVIAESAYNATLYSEVMAQLKTMPQYAENPLHIKDMVAGAKKIAAGIVKYAPKAIKLAETIATL